MAVFPAEFTVFEFIDDCENGRDLEAEVTYLASRLTTSPPKGYVVMV